MTSLSDFAKNLLSRSAVGRRPELPSAVFVALGTGGSDATGVTGEPTGTGYARLAVTFFGTGLQYNVSELRFNFTSAPGTLTHIGLFDAQATGNPILWAPLATPATLNVPGIIIIPVNSLTVVGD
ncbi:MAG: hypothetical protein ACK5X9_18500 [Alphaproteobacteria bacterium]|jgi:hypothetical protein